MFTLKSQFTEKVGARAANAFFSLHPSVTQSNITSIFESMGAPALVR